jgi:hypothetical protein
MNPLILPLDLWVSLLVPAVDKVPAPEDVKAGWLALGVFVALAVAVALLGVSLTRHLRKARDNADRGAFDPSDKRRPHRR